MNNIQFEKSDACTTPVVEVKDVQNIKHFKERQCIIKKNDNNAIDSFEIAPSPKLSGYDLSINVANKIPLIGEHTVQV